MALSWLLNSCRFILLVIFLIDTKPIIADNPRIQVQKYSIADGLSSNHVNFVFKDSQGFIWVATSDGLNRFDGRKFQVFKHSFTDSNTIPGNIIYRIAEDKSGNIWISTPQGICYYNFTTRRIQRINTNAGDDRPRYLKRHVFADSKNRVWFNNEKGVECIIQPTGTRIQYQFEKIGSTSEISQFFEDRDKNIWAVTIDGIFRFNENKRMFMAEVRTRSKLSSDFISGCITQTPDHRFYIGLWADGIADFSMSDKQYTEGSISRSIWTISLGFNDTTLLASGTNHGMYKFYTSSRKLELFDLFNTASQQVEETFIHHIYKDDQGTIWLASEVGLLKYSPDAEQYISIDFKKLGIDLFSDIPGKVVYDPIEPNTIWFYVWSSGIYKINLATNSCLHYSLHAKSKNLKLPGHYVTMLHKDTKGNLWAGIGGFGLYKYDRNSKTFIDVYPDGLSSQFINNNCISLDMSRGDTMTILSSSTGFFEYVPETKYYKEFNSTLPENGNIKLMYCFKMANTNKGDAFIGSRDKGLYFYNRKNNLFTEFNSDHLGTYFPSMYSRDLEVDAEGIIWVATNEGLVKINKDYVIEKVYTDKDGLPTNILSEIAINHKGQILITSDLGLIMLDPKNNQVKLNSLITGSHSFVSNSISLLSDGTVAVGASDRLFLLSQKHFEKIILPPPLILNSIKVLNDEVPFNQNNQYTLKPQQNLLSLHYSLLDYKTSHPVNYQIFMEGLHTDWMEMGNIPNFVFSDLGPGTYQLKVRARSVGYSDWVTLQQPVTIKVLPPFYKTIWFITLVLIVVSTILYLFYRARINQVIQMERVRSSISRDLHDDIGSTLSSINILTSSARKRFEEHDESKLSESLEKISDRTQRMLDNMSDIIWSVKPENDSLDKILARMREYASTLLEAKKIHFTISFPDNIDHLKLPLEVKTNMFLIFKEALNNLIKYSECTHAEISMKMENKKLVMTILDNGIGIGAEKCKVSHGGNGMINMKKRAGDMNAKLVITSEASHGVAVRLEMQI